MTARLTSFFAILTLLTGCFGGGQAVDEREPAELPEFTKKLDIEKVWSKDFGSIEEKKFTKLTPYLDGDAIYAADSNGKVTAYSADKGKKLWRVRLKQDVTGAVGADNDMLLIGTSKGKVIALDKRDGARRWEARVSSEILVPPVAADGLVVVQTIDGKLHGLSALDGKRKWVQQRNEPSLSLRGSSTPVIFQGLVLTGFSNGSVVAVKLADGGLIWDLPIAQPRGRNEIERLVDVDAPLVIANGLLFAGTYQGKAVAVDLRSGRVIWSRDVSLYSGMTADDQALYLTDERGRVTALNQRTGAVLWNQEALRWRMLSAPALVGGLVAVGDYEGVVHWMDKTSGEIVARNTVGNTAIRTTPVVRGDMIYVSNIAGNIAALRPR